MAKGLIEENTLKGIADAIRAKTGSTNTLLPSEMASAIASISTAPVGSIMLWGGIDIPQNWLLCDGEKYKVEDYPELYAVIGDTYGSGPTGFFNIPNLVQRFPLGWGYYDTLGEKGGEEEVTLTVNQIPPHGHDLFRGFDGPNKLFIPTGTVKNATWNTYQDQSAGSMSSAGGGQAHNNMPPYLRIKFIIKVK